MARLIEFLTAAILLAEALTHGLRAARKHLTTDAALELTRHRE